MSLTAKAKGQDFQIPPAGMYAMKCVDVVDLGIVVNQMYGTEAPACRIVWQISQKMDNGKPFIVSRQFTVSLSEKSKLLPFLQGWFGRQLTVEELNGFDLNRLVGLDGLGQIMHRQGKKDPTKTYADVTSIMPLPAGMPPVIAEGYTRKVDRPQEQTTAQNYQQAPPVDTTQTQRFQQPQTQQVPPPPQQQGGPWAQTPTPTQQAPQSPIYSGYDPREDEIPI